MATPLTSLGQALERGTRDRANIALAREAEERQRMQRLSDVQSERDFVVGQRDRKRGLAREAEERQITIKTLIDARFLNPAQVNDPVAVQQAAAAYQEFVENERARRASTLSNAQGEVNQLAADRDILTAKRAEADQRLARLQQQYEEVAAASGSLQPTPQDEMIEALRLAQQAGVVVPTVEPKRSEALREFIAQARDTLQTAAFLAQQETAKRLDGLRRQYEAEVRNADTITRELQVVRQSMDSLQRGFEVAPVRQQRAPAAALQPSDEPVPQAAPAMATDLDRDAARRSLLPGAEQAQGGWRYPREGGPSPAASSPIEPPPESLPPAPAFHQFEPGAFNSRRASNDAVADAMRAVPQNVINFFRPSSWSGDWSGAAFQPRPELRVQQLRDRLGLLSEPQGPAATRIRNELARLQYRLPFQPAIAAELRNPRAVFADQ